MDPVQTVEQFLLKHQICDKKFLLLVSGGADSMVLLDSFVKLIKNFKNNVKVVHFNHNVRPESLNDFKLVKFFCEKLGVEIYCHDLQFESMANFENVARERRYEVAQKYLKKVNFDYLVTGHHLDDNFETILHKMFKGTFLRGLTGIRQFDEKTALLRPLLQCRKIDILDYAKKKKIPFVTDISNEDLQFDRNYLRNKVVPLLHDRYANLAEQFLVKAEFYNELNEFVDLVAWQFIESKKHNYDKYYFFEMEDFNILPRFLMFEVIKIILGVDISINHFQEFVKFISSPKGGIFFLYEDFVFEKNQKKLFIFDKQLEIKSENLLEAVGKLNFVPKFIRQRFGLDQKR